MPELPPQAIPDPKKERIYRIVEGIRVEEGVPDEYVKKYLTQFTSAEKITANTTFNSDRLSWLEHCNVGSTAPIPVEPLKPYARIAEKISAEQAIESRGGGKHYFDCTFQISELNERRGRFGPGSRVELSASDGDLSELLDLIVKNGGQSSDDVRFLFKVTEVDRDGNLILPSLSEIDLGGGKEFIPIPESLQKKITIKQVVFGLSAEPNKPRTFIDQNGWRIDASDKDYGG